MVSNVALAVAWSASTSASGPPLGVGVALPSPPMKNQSNPALLLSTCQL